MKCLTFFRSQHVVIAGCIVIIGIVFLSRPVFAENAKASSVEWLTFSTGVVAAYAIHEFGHITAAHITDTKLRWKAGTANQPIGFSENAKNKNDGLMIVSAGLLLQLVNSEIILRTNKINKKNTFIQGVMAWNIINPISYALDYWCIHRSNFEKGDYYQGDIQGIEYYSDQPTANGFAIAIVAMALSQGYRFLKAQRQTSEPVQSPSHAFHFLPLSKRKFVLSYQIRF